MNNADKPMFSILVIGNDDYLEQCEVARGLTKRERFAMAAMQALLTHDPTDSRILSNPEGRNLKRWIAQDCIEFADALLKEMEETNE